MAETDTQRMDCPSCSKQYRWREPMVGHVVECRQCSGHFIVPAHPGTGLPTKAEAEPEPTDESGESVYDLALDPDDEPEAPAPAFTPPETETVKYEPPAPAVDVSPGDTETSEEPAEVSEAVKAERREQQRKAAAAAQPKRSVRDFKALIILGVIAALIVLTIVITATVSDALDGILGG